MFAFLTRVAARLAPPAPAPPAPAPAPTDQKADHGDGCIFVWVRTPSAAKVDGSGDPSPQIIRIMGIGPKLDIIASHGLLKSEQHLTIDELAAKYPPPEIAD